MALTLLVEPSVRRLILSYGVVPAHPSWLSLLTAPLLHHGLFDGAAGILALWIFGDNVEDRLGHGRFLALFAAGAVAASLAALWLAGSAPMAVIGAVGAVIGAHLVLLPASRVLILVPVWRGLDLVEIPAAFLVLPWIFLTGLVPGVGEQPLAGLPLALGLQASGFLTGAALARLLARPERLRCEWWNRPAIQPPDLRRTSRDTSASSVSSASN